MEKNSKSKRFVQQGKDAVSKHDERFPYRTTFSESEARYTNEQTKENPDITLGGF